MKKLLAMFSLMLIVGSAAAQLPPPINLGIINLPQQTPVWCWVAVARQIIAWKHQSLPAAPEQCALVAMANGAPPAACCSGHPSCIVTGSIPQIQGLIANFGASYSSVNAPANPMVLYNTLQSRRAIILQIATGQNSAHVVVLQGMEWYQTPMGPRAMLYINDPMNMFPAPVPFETIAPIWMSAIVVN